MNSKKTEKNEKVVLKFCDDYHHVEQKVLDIFDVFGLEHAFKNKRVLLKPSIAIPKDPGEASHTHPEFVRGVVRAIKKLRGRPIIGESSVIYGFTREALDIAGIIKVAREEAVEWVNFDACALKKQHINGHRLKEMYLPKLLQEVDYRISLPKLKTHSLSLYTGALKNQMGVIPGCLKARMHLLAPGLDALARAIVDLNVFVAFDFALMDAIWAMEGQGPSSGSVVRSHFIAGSDNLVALDAVCSDLIGIAPEDVLITRIARDVGLGPCDLDKISVAGDTGQIGRRSFQLPTLSSRNVVGIVKDYIFFKLRSSLIRPYAIKDLCRDCRKCADICPTGAITSGKTPIYIKKCLSCFGCYESCPHGAIKLKCAHYAKKSFRQKAQGFALKDLL